MNLGKALNNHIVILLEEMAKDAEVIGDVADSMRKTEDITNDDIEQISLCVSRISKNKSAIRGWYESCQDVAKEDKLSEVKNG